MSVSAWMNLKKRVKNSPIWKQLMSWYSASDSDKYWRQIYYNGITKTIQNTSWWKEITNDTKTNKKDIQKLLGEFKYKIKRVVANEAKKARVDKYKLGYE